MATTPKYSPVERTCRYGHGPLTAERDSWQLTCSAFDNPDAAYNDGLDPPDMAYRVRLWRCPVCGYIEVFDEPGAT